MEITRRALLQAGSPAGERGASSSGESRRSHSTLSRSLILVRSLPRLRNYSPGKGAELSSVWRTRQFEYQWLRALSHRYADFWQATEDALVFAAKSLKLDLTRAQRDQLMGMYLVLPTWPDVPQALGSLRQRGIRLAILSNATLNILNGGLHKSGLQGMFEHVLSTDQIKSYKPDPRAYQLAVDAFQLRREEIGFVAFGGWDVAGAKAFGFPTFWVNRQQVPPEELGVSADGTGTTLNELLKFLEG